MLPLRIHHLDLALIAFLFKVQIIEAIVLIVVPY